MARLLLVRHGDTAANSRERFWGSTDVPLSADGLRQAEALRKRLAAEKIDACYASTLQRARVTAETIINGRNLNVTASPEMREVDFGKLEGLNFQEISAQFPDVYKVWMSRDPDIRYPDGESLAALDARVGQFRSGLSRHGEAETVLVVAHAATLRLLICQFLGMGRAGFWQFRLELASLSIISTYDTGAILSLLNDSCHLNGKIQ